MTTPSALARRVEDLPAELTDDDAAQLAAVLDVAGCPLAVARLKAGQRSRSEIIEAVAHDLMAARGRR